MNKQKPYRKPKSAAKSEPAEKNELLVEGRNPVMEAIAAGRSIDKLYILEGDTKLPKSLPALAKECGAVVVSVSRQKLDMMSETNAHQGVIAQMAGCDYVSVDEILTFAAEKGELPLLVICDHLEDPQNLGAILRNAEAFGAHGVIIPKRRSAGITATVVKAAAGALWHMPIARVPNLTAAIDQLKKAGVWIFGADAQGGLTPEKADFAGATALVIGAEGAGLSALVKQNCDFLVSIPMTGRTGSLNASAAAAVLLYEAAKRRNPA